MLARLAFALLLIAALSPLARAQGLRSAAPAAAAAPAQQRQDLDAIATEAYLYFYPLVMMEVTRRVSVNVPAGVRPGTGGPNEFHHARDLLPLDFKDVVRPNFDTLYSIGWLDLSKEPMIVSAPNTNGRYYLLPMLDAWTDVFAVPGSRTTGTRAGSWALVPPGWTGDLPAGVQRIDAPTPMVWVIGRTQVNGKADVPDVRKVQDGYLVTPLSQWTGTPTPAKLPKQVIDPSVDVKRPPMVQVDTMAAERFFPLAAELMKTNPPHPTDYSQLARIKRLGIEPGKSFDFASAPPEVKAALARAVKAGQDVIDARAPRVSPIVDGWQMNTENVGVYGNNYLRRAVIAKVGLGANQPEDAVYPLAFIDGGGAKMSGRANYTLTFRKGRLPPVGAFWSVTVYDRDGFPIPNKLNRGALGSQEPLKAAADGSTTIYIQPESPGADLEANWLPTGTDGPVSLTLRMYAPKAEVLDGTWTPPKVVKVA